MTELQRLAAFELIWVELALELAYHDECAAFIRGEVDGVPDPASYGLTEAVARQIAVEAHASEVAQTAASYDAMADTVREVPWHQAQAG
jgi:hypothetical protein